MNNISDIGGSLGGSLVNHLCYADDLCLMALGSSGMQCLLDICDNYATGVLIRQHNHLPCVSNQNT